MGVEVELVELEGALRRSRKHGEAPDPFRQAFCVCRVQGRPGFFEVWPQGTEENVDAILAQPQAAERLAELGCRSITKYVGHLQAVSSRRHELGMAGAIEGVFSTEQTYRDGEFVENGPDGPPRLSLHEGFPDGGEFDRDFQQLRMGDRVYTHFDPERDDPILAGEGRITGLRPGWADVQWDGAGEIAALSTDRLLLGERPTAQMEALQDLMDALPDAPQNDCWGMEP